MQPFERNKILGHIGILNSYLNSDQFYAPIQVEIDLTNACTSDCPWCAGFKQRKESKSVLLGVGESRNEIQESSRLAVQCLLKELQQIGVKSVVFTGGGDPTVHDHWESLIRFARNLGLEVALITNGVIDVSGIVPFVEWVRFSVDAGSEEVYEKQHGRKNHFRKVIDNVSAAVESRGPFGGGTIGVGYVLSAELIDDIEPFVDLWRDIAVDYIQFRPRMDTLDAKWGDSNAEQWAIVDRMIIEKDRRVVKSLAKTNGIETGDNGRTKFCHGSFLETAIAADGHVYLCCHLKGDRNYSIGSLHEESFESIWNRHLSSPRVFETTADCPSFCRHYGTNRLVQLEIIEPKTHRNFI